jgi:hypothetical protein
MVFPELFSCFLNECGAGENLRFADALPLHGDIRESPYWRIGGLARSFDARK